MEQTVKMFLKELSQKSTDSREIAEPWEMILNGGKKPFIGPAATQAARKGKQDNGRKGR